MRPRNYSFKSKVKPSEDNNYSEKSAEITMRVKKELEERDIKHSRNVDRMRNGNIRD